MLEGRHILNAGFIVLSANDRQRAFIADAAVLRFIVADNNIAAHRQARFRLVEDLAAVPQGRVALHAAARKDHRSVIGDAAARVQRGVARDASAFHDQRAQVPDAPAVVMESSGKHTRAAAVPESEHGALPDFDYAPLALSLPGIHGAIEHMAVQIEGEALARRDGDLGIRIQCLQILGQGYDLPVLGPVDGVLQG